MHDNLPEYVYPIEPSEVWSEEDIKLCRESSEFAHFVAEFAEEILSGDIEACDVIDYLLIVKGEEVIKDCVRSRL